VRQWFIFLVIVILIQPPIKAVSTKLTAVYINILATCFMPKLRLPLSFKVITHPTPYPSSWEPQYHHEFQICHRSWIGTPFWNTAKWYGYSSRLCDLHRVICYTHGISVHILVQDISCSVTWRCTMTQWHEIHLTWQEYLTKSWIQLSDKAATLLSKLLQNLPSHLPTFKTSRPYPYPQQDISTYKSLMLWEGCLSFKQYLTLKSPQSGIKTSTLLKSSSG
jgi:hypothetical protein